MIKDIPYDGFGTKTGKALKYLFEQIFSNPMAGIRRDAEKIVIVLTDGKPQDEVVGISEEIYNNGVEIIAVGVGNEISTQGLQDIAQPKDNWIHIPDYSNSEIDTAVPKIQKKVCKN